MRKSGVIIVTTIVLVNVFIWATINRPKEEAAFFGTLQGVSFSPYAKHKNPLNGDTPSIEEIDNDLSVLEDKVRRVRTYTSTEGIEEVPALAQKYDLTVTAGAWISEDKERNTQEVANLIKNARQYSNIDRVLVGNEAILRGDVSVKELAAYIKAVKKKVKLPVSTAEPWHIWLKYPELAKHVDYIAIHILPYWEGIPVDNALDFVMESYQRVAAAFPGKPILIAEIGWPSNGNRYKQSQPTVVNEAAFLRRFFNLAEEKGLDYFVMEAFDQPWKWATEGSVGPHWGLFNADREAKFSMSGDIVANPAWMLQASLATLLGLLPIIGFLLYWREMKARGRLFFAFLVQASASLFICTLFLPLTEHLSMWGKIVWGLLLPAQFALMLVILANGLELTELLWNKGRRRHFPLLNSPRDRLMPKVSLHLAICNEPPQMVIQTLNSLAALDYPSYEVLVIDNNTTDPTIWEPVKTHCEKLGPKFRFFTLGKWSGFKAGALNFALKHTDPAAAIVGIVDSDYIVHSDWLRATVPYFDNAKVGFVQAPQDHREWEGDNFKEMCNWEYAGFFQIGMVHRNEQNAIIQHGTMTLIRKTALADLDGWSEWCICEDAELGLRLLAAGYESVYVNQCVGRGLTPDSFAGYKKQRFRWAYGAVQILKHHWSNLLPWNKQSSLTLWQRYHFLVGWLPWFGDAMHVLFTMAALIWSLGLLLWPQYAEFPLTAFLIPTMGALVFKIVHAFWLYTARVNCTFGQRVAAAIAGMGLTHTIACAILKALFTSNQPFLRTPKAENKPALLKGLLMAREEILILVALGTAGYGISALYGVDNFEANLWITVLAALSLPYIATFVCSLVSVLPVASKDQIPTPATVPPPHAPTAMPEQQRKAA